MDTKQIIVIIRMALLLGLTVAVIWLGSAVIKANRGRAIFEENLYQTLNERDQQIMLANEQQFEALYPKLDSIAKANNIKHITQVHNTDYYYSTDSIITILIPLDTLPHDSIVWFHQKFAFNLDTLCLNIEGIADVKNKELLFSSIIFKDQITTFYFWQRRRLFNWSWTPKWGKKQYRAKTISECTDSISTIDIKIGKE